MPRGQECDLLVIGSGPAGLSAAINGASEGLKVSLLDGQPQLGGQAKESNAIENYPGFPEGITGDDLMTRLIRQAIKFATEIHAPVSAQEIRKLDDGRIMVVADDYSEHIAKNVILSIGLSYRRLEAKNIGQFMGRGVWYGLPPGHVTTKKKCKIVVVGGANSAGQAVLKLAQNQNAEVVMCIRRTITDQMSRYLIDRIATLPNVKVLEGVTVTGCRGKGELEFVELSNGEEVCSSQLFVFIGAVPKTRWLENALQLDDKKFIRTWQDVGPNLLPYETSMAGVFAAGDVRLGSTKRIASAVGEGATALQMVHQYRSMD